MNTPFSPCQRDTVTPISVNQPHEGILEQFTETADTVSRPQKTPIIDIENGGGVTAALSRTPDTTTEKPVDCAVCDGLARPMRDDLPLATHGVAGTSDEAQAALLTILCRPLPIDLPTTSNPAQLHWRKVNRAIRAERQRVAAGKRGERADFVNNVNEVGGAG
jgi:hypothetical protein